jgi:4-amino-4-deoxy-L-arabinose transferase-like glycosyltransferase
MGMIVSADTKKILTKNRAHPIIGKKPILAALLVGLVALSVYLRTLASGIVFGDGSELTTAAYLGGVAHPTGYPLYTMLGYLCTHFLPIGSIAYRMNLISAFAGAGAVAVLYLLALHITRSRLTSLVTAFLLAFSLTFWSQAVVAEVYALHLLFVVAVLLCVVRWDAKGDRRWLLAGALLWGLSFTHHLTTGLLAPGLLYFVLTSRYRGQFCRELRWTVPLFLAPLLLYLYLPLASLRDTAWTFADIRSWEAFYDHISARIYQDRMGIKSWAMLWQHLVDYGGWPVHDDSQGHHDTPAYLLSQFGISLLWLAPWGAYGLFRRRRRLFGLTLMVYLACVAWALYYDIPDIDEYYIPSHMIIALWIGCGLRQFAVCLARLWRRMAVPRKSQRRLVITFGAALLGLPLMLLSLNWQANDMHRDQSSPWLGNAMLDVLKPNAILICQGDTWVFPQLYPHYIENRRPDVTIIPGFMFAVPTDIRLITRLSSRGLIVRLPEAYPRNPTGSERRKLLANVIADNRPTHPIYLAGQKMIDMSGAPELRAAIPSLVRVGVKEPVFEVQDKKPTVASPHQARLAKGESPLSTVSSAAKPAARD